MKRSRVPFFLLISVFWVTCPAALISQQLNLRSSQPQFFNVTSYKQQSFLDFRAPLAADDYHVRAYEDSDSITIVKRPTDGGIREIIPAKFEEKYKKWKDELLSTEFGHQQWDKYSNDKQFILTITINDNEGRGAGTGEYQWDAAGQLVGAKITLGNRMDKGLPNPIYFPVMNSLASEEPVYRISGSILAAAKFAHEFGHVNQTGRMNSDLFQLQNKLMPLYNQILLKNGYNPQAQDLIEMTKQMGGTPVEIWENREYWGEANAMLYLFDRINKEDFYCSVFNKIKRNIKTYAGDYQKRFEEIEETKNLEAACRN